MKLYECKGQSWISVKDDIKVPPGAPEIHKEQVLKFIHIDGMYSLCHDIEGKIVHLVAWAEVEPCKKPTYWGK